MRKKLAQYGPYLYIAPCLIFICAIMIYPTISLLAGSFMGATSEGSEFVGLRNYMLLFKDPLFKTAICNNLKLFLVVPILTVLSLILANILFSRIRGWSFYRSLIFIPFILAITVVGIIFSYLLQYNGVLNTFLRKIGLGVLAKDWLGDGHLAMGTIAMVVLWKQLGFGVILFLARMQSIDKSLLESAELDGASGFKKLWYITIPQCKAIIEFYVITSLIEMLSWMFNYVYVMTSGGPAGSTYVLEYLLYKKAFGGGNYNMAQAVGVIIVLIAAVIIVAQQILARNEEDDQG